MRAPRRSTEDQLLGRVANAEKRGHIFSDEAMRIRISIRRLCRQDRLTAKEAKNLETRIARLPIGVYVPCEEDLMLLSKTVDL